jgi:hypothetical protein
VDDKTFRHKTAPAARGRQQVFVNRDINLMFDGLHVSDSFLLMTRTREIVFRKPEQKLAVNGTDATTETAASSDTDDSKDASASNGATSVNGSAAHAPNGHGSNGVSTATTTTITTTSTITAMAAPTTTATPMGPKAAVAMSRTS